MSISWLPKHGLLTTLISLTIGQAMAAAPNLSLTPWAPNLAVDAVAFCPPTSAPNAWPPASVTACCCSTRKAKSWHA